MFGFEPLSLVLVSLAGAAPDGGVTPGATYRVLHRQCSPCSVTDGVPELNDVRDCGVAGADAGAWRRCVLSALASKRPFRAQLPGCRQELFGRARDGGLVSAWYWENDDDSNGCGGVVWKEACSNLSLSRGGDDIEVHCAGVEGTFDTACRNEERATESLEPARPVAELRCAWRMDQLLKQCSAAPAAHGQAGWAPAVNGPNLLCLDSSEGLNCFPNSRAAVRPFPVERPLAMLVRASHCDQAELRVVDQEGEHWRLTQADGGERECIDFPGAVDWSFFARGLGSRSPPWIDYPFPPGSEPAEDP